jgi:Mn2+/Fe2+ NRAMP family transporter
MNARKRRFNPFLSLGPGLTTGAADDDPSGIATYSQAGAQFGLSMLWTVVLTFPLMVVVQATCGRIGRVTGKGLTDNIRAVFPRSVVGTVVGLLLLANTLNVAADLASMGDASQLVFGGNRHVFTIGLAVGSLYLQVFVPYHAYVRYLKWITISLFAYVAVALVVHVPWLDVLHHTFLPHFKIGKDAATLVVAIFGTTISPYLFFWQASEEVEEIHNHKSAQPLHDDPGEGPEELERIGWDTTIGMFYSNAIAFFIILCTAVTLNAAGVTNIQTAAQAAGALKPLAGNFAFLLFSLGIVSTGLLAVPVLAGSGAYALAEARGWKEGLENKLSDAREFYAVIAFSVAAGVALDFSPIDPIKALFWSAVVNGVIAVPLMAVIMILATRKSVMGEFVVPAWQSVLGWLATAIMGLVAVAMFVFS